MLLETNENLSPETFEYEKIPLRFSIFGKSFDDAMAKYLQSIHERVDLFSIEKRKEFQDLFGWQYAVKKADTNQRKYHNNLVNTLLDTGLFEGEIRYYTGLKKGTINFSYEEKFENAKIFSEKIKNLYIRIMDLVKHPQKNKNSLTPSTKIPINKDEYEDIGQLLDEIKAQGIKLNHDSEDIIKFIQRREENKTTGDIKKTIFDEKVDEAIKNCLDAGDNVGRTVARYHHAEKWEEDKYYRFFVNADREKSNRHKNLARVLEQRGFLPAFDHEYLDNQELWNDKGKNLIRVYAENFIDVYMEVVSKL